MVITSYIASPQHNIINIVIHILSFSLILNFDIVLKCQYFFKKIKKAMINIIKNHSFNFKIIDNYLFQIASYINYNTYLFVLIMIDDHLVLLFYHFGKQIFCLHVG